MTTTLKMCLECKFKTRFDCKHSVMVCGGCNLATLRDCKCGCENTCDDFFCRNRDLCGYAWNSGYVEAMGIAVRIRKEADKNGTNT